MCRGLIKIGCLTKTKIQFTSDGLIKKLFTVLAYSVLLLIPVKKLRLLVGGLHAHERYHRTLLVTCRKIAEEFLK